MNLLDNLWLGVAGDTPLGPIWTAVSEVGLVAVRIGDDQVAFEQTVVSLTGIPGEVDTGRTTAAVNQIDEYLKGRRQEFDLSIHWPLMRPFQQEVLHAVCAVPYGRTATYGQIAGQIGKDKGAARAVGRANATNPIPLVIPCHRILASDGGLQGYGGGKGLETKAWLLRLEGSRLL